MHVGGSESSSSHFSVGAVKRRAGAVDSVNRGPGRGCSYSECVRVHKRERAVFSLGGTPRSSTKGLSLDCLW